MLTIGLCVFFADIIYADVPDSQAGEVNHLLSFVKNSQCVISRNGAEHVGEKSARHIQIKYDYFRDDINSTEDFIQYSATKSTMSGQYYTVLCPGEKTINTEDWLLVELKRFRKNQK